MAVKEAAKQGDAMAFDKADLIANSKQLFQKSPDVVAGALHEVHEPITIDKAKEAIEVFLKKPINNEKGGN